MFAKKRKILTLALALCLSMAGFGKTVTTVHETTTILEEKFVTDTFKDGEVDFEYTMWQPIQYAGERHPFLVIFDASNGNYDTTMNNAKKIIGSKVFDDLGRGYVLIPKMTANMDEAALLALQNSVHTMIDLEIKSGNVDRNKVYAIGVNEGGSLLYAAIAADPRAYTGIYIENGVPGKNKIEMAKNMPMYINYTESPETGRVFPVFNRMLNMGNRFVEMCIYPTGTKGTFYDKAPFTGYQEIRKFIGQKTFVLPNGKEGLLFVNGNKIDEKPVRIKGELIVSLEDIITAIGGEIVSNDNSAIVVKKGDTTVSVTKEKKAITVNGEKEKYFLVADMFNRKIMVRPDLFSKYFGCVVKVRNTGAGVQVEVNSK